MHAADVPYNGEFAQPSDPRKFDWAWACIGLLSFFSLVLWVGVLGQLIYYVPHSQRLFDEFRMKLPHVTVLVIHHAWWMTLGSILATLGVCLATRSRWAWFVLLVVLPLVINVFVFVSMTVPREMLLEALLR